MPHLWEKSYPPELNWHGEIITTSLGEFFDNALEKYADLNAIDYRDKKITYYDLGRQVHRFAASLLKNGYKNETLALYLPNTPYHPFCFLGAAYAGVRLTHLSPLDAERVLVHKLKDSGARTVVTVNFAPMLAVVSKLLEAGVIDKIIVCEDEAFDAPLPANAISYEAFTKGVKLLEQRPKVDVDSIALIQYTGGTTGMPKGAMLSHKNLTACVSSYTIWFDAIGLSQNTEDKVIGVLPLFHIYALSSVMLRNIHAGNEILLHLKFDAQTILNDIEHKGATAFPAVPTMWIALANVPDIESRNFSKLRYCASGGAPMPIEVANKMANVTKLHMGGGWGMTETSPSGTNIPRHIEKKGTIGLPLPGITMCVVSNENPDKTLAPNEIGELAIKGKNVFSGYLNQKEATKKAFNKQSFFLTGDIGFMDEDGFFFIVDRKNDMIISGGFNVYPQMIEQAIYEHSSVLETIVLGVKDEYRGESAKAFITLKEGMAVPSFEEMQAFLKPRLGKHEMISGLEIRETLPKTPVGKLSRAELRKELKLA